MRLSNEFVVAADLDVVWHHLLDFELVAECVPGARIEEVVDDSTYKGTIRLRIGPMTVEYRGQASLVEVDEAAHRARIELKAREARGQGSALATVHNRLEADPGGTRVIAETDLQITGPQAQFGKGVLEDVGGRILEEFSTRLERRINSGSGARGGGEGDVGAREASKSASTPAPGAPGRGPGSSEQDDALDLNRVIGASLRARAGKLAAVGAGMLVLALLVLRPWRGRSG
ncbi:MAG TPA: SRPBCC family protein [Acidimicrobiales bacterium]|nr:SRPBCC family protein [Acidimicrobiales bacterium]